MTHESYDIVVAGGGIAGLTAAAAFGHAGFSVICVDPQPPVTDETDENADIRTTALLQPARDLLQRAGLWDALAPFGTPLQVMRVADAGGPDGAVRRGRAFDAKDVSEDPFGWNFPNWLLRREVLAQIQALPNVTFQPGVAAERYLGRTAEARVRLSDGSDIRARLVIAADGRNSPMRQEAGIGVQTTQYGQKALAFAVTHPIPHNSCSTEIHRTGGPFTLVPLPDHDGQPRSAVVWMDDAEKCEARFASDIDDFETEASERSGFIQGPLKLASHRSIWPIISQRANRLTATRLALVAEAAHVVPPIGAQGLNMSLADIATLLKLAEESRESLGDETMLAKYERARATDIRARVAGIDMLNRISQAESPALRDARAWGIQALHRFGPVRRTLMRLGLGLQKIG